MFGMPKRGEQAVKFPACSYITWSGQFEYLERAKRRLQSVVSLTPGIIFLLPYPHSSFRRFMRCVSTIQLKNNPYSKLTDSGLLLTATLDIPVCRVCTRDIFKKYAATGIDEIGTIIGLKKPFAVAAVIYCGCLA
jgi:hypothetical protein